MKDDKGDFLSKKTKRGILALAILCLMIAFAPRIYRKLFPFEEVKLSIEELAVLEEEKAQVADGEAASNFKKKSAKSKEERPCVLPKSKFDPNKYSLRDWQALGLSEKQANVVVKFSKSGIRSIDDLKKVYVLSESFLACISDSLIFEDDSPVQGAEVNRKLSEAIELVNINTASREELMSVPGIGKFYAKKIIELRTSLGGIHSINQLKDFPYMDEEKLTKLKGKLKVSDLDVKQLNINRSTVEELKSHPYLSYNVANSIVKMRKQKGTYTQLDEIQKSVLIDEELFQKIKPYLSL